VSKAGRGGTDFSPSPYDHGCGTPPDDLLPLIQCGLQLSVFCQIQGDCCASVTAFAETCWYNACVVGQDDLIYWVRAACEVLRTAANLLQSDEPMIFGGRKILRNVDDVLVAKELLGYGSKHGVGYGRQYIGRVKPLRCGQHT
jgi:hypothetical protein